MSARHDLVKALDDLTTAGYPAPCTVDSKRWDVEPADPQKARKIAARRAACEQCPALAACAALRAEELGRGLKPYGVIAGHVHGLGIVSGGGGARAYTPEMVDDAITKYRAGETPVAVATAIGVDPKTVRRWVRAAGVARTRGEAQRNYRRREAAS